MSTPSFRPLACVRGLKYDLSTGERVVGVSERTKYDLSTGEPVGGQHNTSTNKQQEAGA